MVTVFSVRDTIFKFGINAKSVEINISYGGQIYKETVSKAVSYVSLNQSMGINFGWRDSNPARA